MSLAFLDTVTSTRPGSQSRTATGGFSDGADTAVYSGAGDYQDGGRPVRNDQGALVFEGDGTLFLPSVADALSHQAADAVTIAFGGANGSGSASFVVREVSRLDGGIILQRT